MNNRRSRIISRSFRKFFTLFIVSACFFLFSCTSTRIDFSEWKPASNLSDVYGTWFSSKGEYCYPFVVDGKKYMRYASAKSDDTELWNNFALSKNMDLSDLWQKRFVYAPYIYSKAQTLERIPDSDENDIQSGRKFFISDEKIYSRVELLIPERLVAINLNFFVLRKDGKALKEQDVFYLASNKFPDIKSDDILYFKIGENIAREKAKD